MAFQSTLESLIQPAANCPLPVLKKHETNFDSWSNNLKLVFRLRGPLVAGVAQGELLNPNKVPMPDPRRLARGIPPIPRPVVAAVIADEVAAADNEDGEVIPAAVDIPRPPPAVDEDRELPLIVPGVTYFQGHAITAEHWMYANDIARQYLLSSLKVGSADYEACLREKHVSTLWLRLHATAAYSDRLRKTQLLSDLKTFHQREGEDVLDYSSRLDSLSTSLALVSKDKSPYSSDFLLATFIAGLLPKYHETVQRAQTDGCEDKEEILARLVRLESSTLGNPSQEGVAMLVKQQEPQSSGSVTAPSTSTTQAANQGGGRGNGRRNRPRRPYDATKTCKHCKRVGHSVDECGKLAQFLQPLSVAQKIMYLTAIEDPSPA